jgi:hypothetical protein
MPLSETYITIIAYIVAAIVPALLAKLVEHIYHRATLMQTQKLFLLLLKNYDNKFLKLLNDVGEYLDRVTMFIYEIEIILVFFIGWFIPAPYDVITLTILIGLYTAFHPAFLNIIEGKILKVPASFKTDSSQGKTLKRSLNDTIQKNLTMNITIPIIASLAILLKFKPITINTILIWLTFLFLWLVIANVQAILRLFTSNSFKYDKALQWELAVVNLWLSNPNFQTRGRTNENLYITLFLDDGKTIEGRLVYVDNDGVFLEAIPKDAKIYVGWERIKSVFTIQDKN